MALESLEERCLLSYTEFPVPTPASGLTALTSGPDGNLWFLEFRANQVGKISTDGVFTEYPIPTPNSQPAGLAAGPDGNLWFAEFNGNQIGRITPKGAVTEFPGPTPNSHLEQITAGADGNLWFLDDAGGPGRRGAVGRITPAGDITEFPVVPQLNGGTHRIAAGPDGNVWFAEIGALGRVTPTGDITLFPLHPANIVSGIVAGPDGNVWFTDAEARAVGRMNPTTGKVTAFQVPSGNIPSDITVGPNGNLWFAEQSVRALVNNGIAEVTTDGTFTEFTDPNPGTLPVALANGADGNVFFTDQGRNAIVRFLDDGLPRPLFQPVVTYATDVSPFTVQTADLRGNGTLDLVTGNEFHLIGQTRVPGSVSVLLGNGDGTFGQRVDYPAGNSPRAVAVGNFTGRGILDLVVADEGFFDESGGLRILRGNGDGTFQLAQNILLGRSVFDVVAGDFRHTGHLDLIISTSAGIQELRGNGDGTFQDPVSISTLRGRLTVADFNHDGSLDLAVASSTTVQVFLGHGDGTFALTQEFATGSQFGIVNVLAADLRANGTLDLVLGGAFDGRSQVALGNGDGTFQAPVPVAGFGDFTAGVAVADLTGNGIPDLVLTLSGGVRVLLGNGDGTTFRFGGDFPTGDGVDPFAVAVADLNGDGRPDIVAANSFGGSVGVLINTGAGFGPGTAPGAHHPGAGGRRADGSQLPLPTATHPLAVAARSVPAAASAQAAALAAADSVFATHRGEFASFLLTAAHRKALAQGSGDGLDPLADDLALLASAVS
jgi:virginiamycin B lyase